jgi:hypothetical protein
MRPVMTMTTHMGYTEGSRNRELALPGGSEVSISTPRKRSGAVSACELGTARRSCGAVERWTRETSHDKVMARVL